MFSEPHSSSPVCSLGRNLTGYIIFRTPTQILVCSVSDTKSKVATLPDRDEKNSINTTRFHLAHMVRKFIANRNSSCWRKERDMRNMSVRLDRQIEYTVGDE